MKTTLYVVTNGTEYAIWDNRRGVWNSTGRFSGECLHAESDAQYVQKYFNDDRSEEDGDPEWRVCEASIEVAEYAADDAGADAAADELHKQQLGYYDQTPEELYRARNPFEDLV